MSTAGLRGLPAYLRFLTTYPAPESAVASLRTGVLSSLGARTITVWALLDGDLVMVAQDGHTPEEADRYSVLPGHLDLLIWRAVRSGSPVVTGEDDVVLSNFTSVDEESWSSTMTRVDTRSVVRSPILHCGQSVGAIGMLVDRAWGTDGPDGDLLEVLSHVLGLWITSPESGARAAAAANRVRSASFRLAFTERQQAIMRMVEQDMTTPRIALALRQSESTVKQDIQHVMRALNTRNRSIAAARARELGLI